jgi:hypothetical protein
LASHNMEKAWVDNRGASGVCGLESEVAVRMSGLNPIEMSPTSFSGSSRLEGAGG